MPKSANQVAGGPARPMSFAAINKADGEPITTGVIAGLITVNGVNNAPQGTIGHETGGIWEYNPGGTELDVAGAIRLVPSHADMIPTWVESDILEAAATGNDEWPDGIYYYKGDANVSTDWPSGTRTKPIGDLATAIALAKSSKAYKLNLDCDPNDPISGAGLDFSDLVCEGHGGHVELDLGAASSPTMNAGTVFRSLSLILPQNEYTHAIGIHGCVIGSGSGADGWLRGLITDSVFSSGSGINSFRVSAPLEGTHLIRCVSDGRGIAPILINSSQKMILVNWNGSIDLNIGIGGCSLNMDGGQPRIIDGTGLLTLTGQGSPVEVQSGSTVIDQTGYNRADQTDTLQLSLDRLRGTVDTTTQSPTGGTDWTFEVQGLTDAEDDTYANQLLVFLDGTNNDGKTYRILGSQGTTANLNNKVQLRIELINANSPRTIAHNDAFAILGNTGPDAGA